MQYTAETVQSLSQCFLQTLVPNPEPRRQAEDFLKQAADQPGYGITILRLLSEPSVDEQVRQSAAVNFKNHVRYRWAAQDPESPPDFALIQEPEKEQIKGLIVGTMLSAQPRVQSQLSEALAIISKHDFPKTWQTLLPELVSNLRSSTDYAVINGILHTANSIFKKFRYAYKSNDLYIDLKYCLDGFAAPLLDIFLRTGELVAANLQNAVILGPLFECQRLCCRIFYSLNSQELPEFFENHMKEWMGEFRTYLITPYPALGDSEEVVDHLRAAICENINLYMEKNEEEFRDYLKDFASAIWSLLMTISSAPSRDRLAVTAIKFLTTVSKSVHHALFSSVEILQQICQSIVVPNVMIREEEEELFEMNHVEYIRRDIEGSDLDTRRRMACELVKGLGTHHREQVMAMISMHIQNLQAKSTSNPTENWKEKDCAIYLVVSLAAKQAPGAAVSTDLVNFEQFVMSMIMPELQSEDVHSQPILKADALKFLTTFRYQIPKATSLSLILHVMRFLLSESNVVHSYAANCIEKMLLVRDGNQLRYTSADVNQFLQPLMTNLFNTLKLSESQENSYVMKCIMRVLGIADLTGELAIACLTGLTSILNEVCKNPKNPTFNHYLFESVAALVRRSCEREPALLTSCEANLFPVLQTILVQDVTEFLPYALQLLAQLIEINRPPLPPTYMQIFQLLLSPETWQKKANVPALVRLLQAYLQKSPQELSQEGRLSQVLGIFQKLISSKSTDHLGFFILNTTIENLSYEVLSPYLRQIWTTLFLRIENQHTLKFVKSLIIFMSLFLVKHGHVLLADSINSIQPNLFIMILERFWVPTLKSITGVLETKLCSVASTRLLCESLTLMDDSCALLWGKMLDSIMSLIVRPEEERVEEEIEVPDLEETMGYTPAFAQLYNAGKKEEDPVKDINDLKGFLVTSLAGISARAPGKYPAIIQQSLEPSNQVALVQFCSTYGFNIA
uniref:TSA: Wollemia nobilis Ref_Wollemi_Transcript_13726_3457 transcribed RNA sequence n=1 Tax=Wollemia nobilis TaxID=56998 RepID=A0A0C9S7F6_9CONI